MESSTPKIEARRGRPATRTNRWFVLVSLLLQLAGEVAIREEVEHRRSVRQAKTRGRDHTGRPIKINPAPPAPTSIAAAFTEYAASTLSRVASDATALGLVEERPRDSGGILPPTYSPAPSRRRPHWGRRLSVFGVQALGGKPPEGWRGHWPSVDNPTPEVAPDDLYPMMVLVSEELDREKSRAAMRH